MHRRLGWILGLVAALLLVGGVAVASIPDASGVIHGCRKTNGGALSVIDSATQTCPSGTVPLNWATGPKAGTLYEAHRIVRLFALPDDGQLHAYTSDCPAGEAFLFGSGIVGNNTRSALFAYAPPTDLHGDTPPFGATFASYHPWPGTGDDAYINAQITCAKVSV